MQPVSGRAEITFIAFSICIVKGSPPVPVSDQRPSSTPLPELHILAPDQFLGFMCLPSSYINPSTAVPSSCPDPALIPLCYMDKDLAEHRKKVQ